MNLKLIQQTPMMCGPYSLKMVFDYLGVEKTIEELITLTGATSDGCSQQSMIDAAQAVGLQATYNQRSSIDDVRQQIAEDHPVIVLWFSPEFGGHYSPVVEVTDDKIILADPLKDTYRHMNIADFMYRWFELDAYPPVDPSKFTLRESIVIHR